MATSELNDTSATPGEKTDLFSSEGDNKRSIRGQSRETLKDATWLWGRGGVEMRDVWSPDRGNRRLPCDRCWRKSLKCLYDTDGFHDVFC